MDGAMLRCLGGWMDDDEDDDHMRKAAHHKAGFNILIASPKQRTFQRNAL